MIFSVVLTSMMFVARSAIAMSLGMLTSFKTEFGRTRKIFNVAVPEKQLKKELLTDLKIVPFYSVMVAIGHQLNLIHYSDFSWGGTLATFAILFVWNETWFYAFHRMIHTPRFMWIHADHHRSRVTTPLTVSVFSFAEQTSHLFLAVSVPAVLSHFIPITFAGVIIYSIPMILVNVLGHMNVEVYPAWMSSTLFGKIFGTPTYHALHHARVKGHYGLLTSIPDRLFGSYFEDYPLVQARAASGNGLKSIGERIPVKAAA